MTTAEKLFTDLFRIHQITNQLVKRHNDDLIPPYAGTDKPIRLQSPQYILIADATLAQICANIYNHTMSENTNQLNQYLYNDSLQPNAIRYETVFAFTALAFAQAHAQDDQTMQTINMLDDIIRNYPDIYPDTPQERRRLDNIIKQLTQHQP